MSIKVMNRVWESAPVSKGSLLVLLAIADFADDDGSAYPSVGTLAKKARLEERQVRRVLRDLEGRGLLQMRYGEGPNGVTVYTIKQWADNLSGGTFLPANLSKMSPKPSGNLDDDDLDIETDSSSSTGIGGHFRQRLADIFGTDAVDQATDTLEDLPIPPDNPEGWLIAHLRGMKAPGPTDEDSRQHAWLARRYKLGFIRRVHGAGEVERLVALPDDEGDVEIARIYAQLEAVKA